MSGRLEGRRLLVVGGSSGIGRASGLAAAAEGARVAFAARRTERIAEAAREAGNDAIAVACDALDEGACKTAVSEAADAFGGLDAIVYAPGVGIPKPIEALDADDWRRAFDLNVIGATSITRFALPHLAAARGKAVFISSISIDDQPPRPGFAPYVVSKTALETLVRAWQGEHREVAFTTIAMGDTLTEFGHDYGPELIGGLVQRWVSEGYMYGRAMDPAPVAEQIVNVLASSETIRRLAITPNYGDPGGNRSHHD